MKGLTFLVILVIFSQVNCEKKSGSDNRLIASAFCNIFENYFEPRMTKVDVLYYGVKGGSSEQIAELILQAKLQFVSVKLSHLNETNIDEDQISEKSLSAIHIFDSYENYRDLSSQLTWLNDPIRRYEQLFYIPNFTSTDIAALHESHGNFYASINFLIFDSASNSIDLVATFLFTPTSCRALQPTTINRFDRNTQRWENSNFFPMRYQTFNGCNLKFRQFVEGSPHMMKFVVYTLAKHLNFSIRPYQKNSRDYDTTIGYGEAQRINGEPTVRSVVIDTDTLTFLIPPGELYTQFEKLFMAFAVEVWIAIGATFVIKFIAIQVINFMSVKVQKFVYGRDVKTPTLNLISIFLLGSQHRVPGRNFARFILTLVLVWSLIIRTCYQSKLFEFLQADLRKPRFETIDQLADSDFTLYEPPNAALFVNPTLIARFKNRLIVDEKQNVTEGLRHKGTFIYDKEKFKKIMMNKSNRYLYPPLYPLKESIRMSHVGLMFTRTIPFFERFNELIDQMVSHGLTNYEFMRQYGRNQAPHAEPVGPQVLTMEHIGIGFIAVLFFLGLSIVAFIVEKIYFSLSQVYQKRA